MQSRSSLAGYLLFSYRRALTSDANHSICKNTISRRSEGKPVRSYTQFYACEELEEIPFWRMRGADDQKLPNRIPPIFPSFYWFFFEWERRYSKKSINQPIILPISVCWASKSNSPLMDAQIGTRGIAKNKRTTYIRYTRRTSILLLFP